MQFIYSYPGNKRKEFNYIEPFITKKLVIEPFCGSSSTSFLIHKKNPETKFILTDIDETLIKVYELMKNTEPCKIEEEINKIIQSVETKEDYLNISREYLRTFCVYKHIYLRKYGSMGRPHMFDVRDMRGTKQKTVFKLTKEQLEFIKFISSENVIIKCCDWFETFEENKNNKDACFIFDPPYVLSSNELYTNFKTSNIYEYFFNNNINNFSSDIIFWLEKNWIVELLFSGHEFIDYDKTYSVSKKKTVHKIIKNTPKN